MGGKPRLAEWAIVSSFVGLRRDAQRAIRMQIPGQPGRTVYALWPERPASSGAGSGAASSPDGCGTIDLLLRNEREPPWRKSAAHRRNHAGRTARPRRPRHPEGQGWRRPAGRAYPVPGTA